MNMSLHTTRNRSHRLTTKSSHGRGVAALTQLVYLTHADPHTPLNSIVQHFLQEAQSNICMHNLPEHDTIPTK